MGNIKNIEKQLLEILDSGIRSWAECYRLMQTVQDEELYTPEYTSFNKWMNAMADKSGVHVSLLWQRLKAGRVYDSYETTAAEHGKVVVPVEKANIPAESLDLIAKIAGNDQTVLSNLIEKTAARKLTRQDLKSAWQTVRAERESKGEIPAKKTRHDTPPETTDTTAAEIILSLSNKENFWLEQSEESHKIPRKYNLQAEFPVRTGSSRKARRLDALIAETVTSQHAGEICLHGIEIKVSKSDLKGDQKMEEYATFVDCFWLAVPPELVSEADEVRLDTWGVLSVSKTGDIAMIHSAKKQAGKRRTETLMDLAIRLI